MARHRLVRPWRIVLGIAAFALALARDGMPAWAEDLESWVAVEVGGAVAQRNADGVWQAVEPGTLLAAGASLRTGDGAMLVLSHGGDRVTVSPNSELQIPAHADPANGASIIERIGTILFRVEHSPGRRFEVESPYLAAVVKGTVFTVSTSDTASSVHLAEGSVEVSAAASKETALLRPGETAVVAASGKDISILGRPGSTNRQHSENDPPEREEKSGAAAITRTLGEEHLDVGRVSNGLLAGSGRDGQGMTARSPAAPAETAPLGDASGSIGVEMIKAGAAAAGDSASNTGGASMAPSSPTAPGTGPTAITTLGGPAAGGGPTVSPTVPVPPGNPYANAGPSSTAGSPPAALPGTTPTPPGNPYAPANFAGGGPSAAPSTPAAVGANAYTTSNLAGPSVSHGMSSGPSAGYGRPKP